MSVGFKNKGECVVCGSDTYRKNFCNACWKRKNNLKQDMMIKDIFDAAHKERMITLKKNG